MRRRLAARDALRRGEQQRALQLALHVEERRALRAPDERQHALERDTRAEIANCNHDDHELEQRESATCVTRGDASNQPRPPAPAAISHSGKNTPSASTGTMAPTTTINSGSIAALRFSRS